MNGAIQQTPHRQRARISRTIRISLPYQPPLDWEHLLGHFRSHLIPCAETTTDSVFERTFRIGGDVGAVRVSHDPSAQNLRLEIRGGGPDAAKLVAPRIRRMFDLDLDPLQLAGPFDSHKELRAIWKKYPGLRMSTGWDPFETVVATILGQLVSVTQARALLRQLIESHGEQIRHPVTGKPTYQFPTPTVLAAAELAAVRTSPARKVAIRSIAGLVASGDLDLTGGSATALAVKEKLLAVPGIGPWSAEYIGMRALGDTDSFPRTDLFIKRALQKHPGLDLKPLRPWRGYAAVYLWMHYAKLSTKE